MKGIIVYFLVVTFTWFQVRSAEAQLPFLDSLGVLPEDPDDNDTIRIFWKAGTPNIATDLGESFSRNGYQINVQRCYQQGFGNMPTLFRDTLTVGVLPAGDYQIRLLGYMSSDTADCVPIDSNSTWKPFTVADATGIDPDKLTTLPTLVFPNPARDVLNILSGEAWQRLVIFDTQGRRIKTIQNTGSNPIDISAVAAGVYFLRLELKSGKNMLRLIKE